MTDHIEPALTPEQWAEPVDESGQTLRCLDYGSERVMVRTSDGDIAVNWDGGYDGEMQKLGPTRYAVMALINDSLDDADPRKITRAKLRRIRQLMGVHEDEEVEFLDALASYLPPVNTAQAINAELQANPTQYGTSES